MDIHPLIVVSLLVFILVTSVFGIFLLQSWETPS